MELAVVSALSERAMYDAAFQAACQRYAHGNGSSGAIASAALSAVGATEMYDALVAVKQEMWLSARTQWTLADFNNWAIIQQINAALTKADGKARSAAA